MVLIIVLLYCVFFLPFPSEVSLYFSIILFRNQNRLRFKKILEIKLIDKNIASKKG